MSHTTLLAVNAVFLVIMLITAVAIARQRNLFVAAMMMSLYSLSLACLFVLLDAVDVAFTEASVGAGISTVLLLSALALTEYRDRPPQKTQHYLALCICAGVAVLLLIAASEWPHLGAENTPIHQHPLTQHFLQQSAEDTGLPNVVTSVLASYRGYDTLGEVTVVFTAGLAVLMLLLGVRKEKAGS
ncbi:MAG: DUF4040 domain-containing protein [Oceanococcus sp.]